jgi:hypothetical protein
MPAVARPPLRGHAVEPETAETIFNEPVAELIALATAMAANNEDAFQQANLNLEKLGVSRQDRIQAVNIAIKVKMMPHSNLMDMAQGYLAGGGCGGECGGGCEAEGACGEEGCTCAHE